MKPYLKLCSCLLLFPTFLAARGDAPPDSAPIPGATLADDAGNAALPLLPDYAAHHPRLLFSDGDREALRLKARENPKLWDPVVTTGNALLADAIPNSEAIQSGDHYWRATFIEASALAWFVTGEGKYRDAVLSRLLAYGREPVWGNTAWRPNIDLVASWYLYYLSISYDIVSPTLEEADRKAIRDGLAAHARAIYESFDPAQRGKFSYDQNHIYTPAVALTAAGLALLGDVPEAADWVRRANTVLQRSRYVLGEDGYYYEGYGYWSYALHWHVRFAELMARATGSNLFALPALRDNWLFALHLSLPGAPGAFDVGDTGTWSEPNKRPDIPATNFAMLWKLAQANQSGESRAVGDLYNAREPDTANAATAFLWFPPAVPPVPLDQIKPYHHFLDHDVVAWRSGWGPGASCYLFRCGPPLGHSATAKLERLTDWEMNCGHVHADIGSFLMYAKGAYLAVGTGYTAQKWTRDQNTLLVDGKGQAMEGVYHHLRGFPYPELDQARIDRSYLSDGYGFASGSFGTVYSHLVPGVKLRRSVLMTERWLLVVDDLEGEGAHRLTWLCHADAPFKAEGPAYVAHLPAAALAVIPLSSDPLQAAMGPSTVIAGIGGKTPSPDHGEAAQHGYQLSLTQTQPVAAARLINLLVPLAPGQKVPEAALVTEEKDRLTLTLQWPGGKTEKAALDLQWQSGGDPGPAAITSE